MARKAKPILLAGDNPRIAKAEGDAPVQEQFAAVPGWGARVNGLFLFPSATRRDPSVDEWMRERTW